MSNCAGIDLEREILELIAQEHMLAYFDFTIGMETNKHISGLCKITKPKAHTFKIPYLSLIFILDTPTLEDQAAIEAYMQDIRWNNLSRIIPEVESAVPMPALNSLPQLYIKETDLYLRSEDQLQRQFLKTLFPAIRKIMGVVTSEIVFWEDDSGEKRTALANNIFDTEHKPALSLFERLRNLFSSGKQALYS